MELVLPHARAIADEIAASLVRRGVRAETVGALRRAEELVDELVFVCDRAAEDVAELIDATDLRLELVDGRLEGALTLEQGAVPIRFHCTSASRYVEALIRHTGSDDHVTALVARAAARGLTLAQLSSQVDDELAVYDALELPYVSPELRDATPIAEPSLRAPLLDRVRGTFHVHTRWSDGMVGVAPMARAARTLGLEYLGISDHSRAAFYANGLSPERLSEQRDDVERARREVHGITLLHGVECDVLEDGTLDLPDDALRALDFVIVSTHTHLDLDRHAQTRRVVRALAHPLVTILGHPTGRLLLGRPGIELDLDEVAKAAAQHGVFLEINTTAQRLDLSASQAARAASFGASFSIDPDAHEPRGLETLPFGVLLARRARLSAERVLNSRSASEVQRMLRARKLAALA
jgi:DNA polymerase (family 10)